MASIYRLTAGRTRGRDTVDSVDEGASFPSINSGVATLRLTPARSSRPELPVIDEKL